MSFSGEEEHLIIGIVQKGIFATGTEGDLVPPSANPAPGHYEIFPPQVTLSPHKPEHSIMHTSDGRNQNALFTRFMPGNTISVDKDMLIKAFSCLDDQNSLIKKFPYTFYNPLGFLSDLLEPLTVVLSDSVEMIGGLAPSDVSDNLTITTLGMSEDVVVVMV